MLIHFLISHTYQIKKDHPYSYRYLFRVDCTGGPFEVLETYCKKSIFKQTKPTPASSKPMFRFAQPSTQTGCRRHTTPSDLPLQISSFPLRSGQHCSFDLDGGKGCLFYKSKSTPGTKYFFHSQVLIVTNASICRSVWSNSVSWWRPSHAHISDQIVPDDNVRI